MDDRTQADFILAQIIDIHAATLQEMLDALASIFSGYGIRSISLFAATTSDEKRLALVASSGSRPVETVLLESERKRANVFLEVGSFYLSIESAKRISTPSVTRKALANKVSEVMFHKRQAIRRAVIEQSIKSKDVNSFLYRLVRAIKAEFLHAEDITVFLCDEKSKKIYLSASTSAVRGIEKKDVYYRLVDTGPIATTYRNNEHYIEDETTHFLTEEFDRNIFSGVLYNRGFWPVSLAWSNLLTIKGQEISPLGVIRVSNLQRRKNQQTWKASFCRYDEIIISFICELIFVLVQQYIQFISTETDIARLTHGLGANIDASMKFAANLRETLFDLSGGDNQVTANFTLNKSSLYKIEDLYLEVKNLEYFLEDLSYQFAKFQTTNSGSYEKEIIEKPYADVLMPAVRLTSAISAVNSKDVPRISNLKARGAQDLPAIVGNRKGFILVLRNLFENSIKYTKDKAAKVELNFSEDDQYLVLDYYDFGIGIADGELEQIFVEGYRSVAARRTSNRGIGVGLSSSREVMRYLDGDLTCLKHIGGAHFQLRMRKAK